VLDRLARRAPGLRTALVAPERHASWCAQPGIDLWPPPSEAREREPLTAWAGSLPLPRLLVADVFPRGVVGELSDLLPRLPRPALLVSRHVRPRAWLEPGIRAALESRYERILWCEDPPRELEPIAVPQRRVAPILISRPEECLDAAAARRELSLPPDGPILLMLGSGDEEEQRDRLRLLLKARSRLAARGACTFEIVALSARLPPTREPGLHVTGAFPAMRFLRAATLLVASGGYASWHEARALGVPAIFLPQPRPWDDQARRVAASHPPDTPEALEAAIAARLQTPPSPDPGPAPPGDGADEVATALAESLHPRPR